MKISINNLGAIKNADLELGDITVILGPPNTGKTYTLKAIYSSLLMLDDVARKFKLEEIFNRYGIVKFSLKKEDIIKILIKILDMMQSHINKGNLNIEDIDNLIYAISSELYSDIKIESVNFEKGYIKITLSNFSTIELDRLNNIIKTKMDSFWDILPIKADTKIASFPNFSEILDMNEILYQSLKNIKKETYEYQSTDFKLKFEMFCEPLICSDNTKLSTVKFKNRITLSFHLKDFEDDKSQKSSIDFLLALATIPLMFSIDLDNLLETYRIEIRNKILESLSNSFKNIYRTIFNLESIRFIPFGRSPFIYQIDYISKDPLSRKELINAYRSDVIYYAYFNWISNGRAKLFEEKEKYDDIIKLFNLVLQGKVEFDKEINEIAYIRNSVKVPIKYSSALAGEVVGILLPILTLPPNSCILIEEPEAQLHYSAQILMALTLAALSKKFGHKIVFSTHSDIFAITLAYLKELKPKEDDLRELIESLLKMQHIDVENIDLEPLLKALSNAGDIDIKFYYYEPTPEGINVVEKPTKEIMKNVPGITEVVDILASWSLEL